MVQAQDPGRVIRILDADPEMQVFEIWLRLEVTVRKRRIHIDPFSLKPAPLMMWGWMRS